MNASAIRLTITQCVRRFLARERAFLRLWTGLGGFLLIGLAACDEPLNVPIGVRQTGGTAVATAGAGTSGKGGAAGASGAAGAGEVAGEGGAAGAGGQ